MKKQKSKSIDVFEDYKLISDLPGKEKKVLEKVKKTTSFQPQKNIWRSSYWGKGLGASHWLGDLDGKRSVLKMQLAKPKMSEIDMINEFTRQNRSQIISPPKILFSQKWAKNKEYEILITEYAEGGQILEGHKTQKRKDIHNFYQYYQEYRKNCLPDNPWLAKPEMDWEEIFKKVLTTSHDIYPDHPFRKKEDEKIAREAYKKLAKIYKNVPLEFVHAHISVNDLKYKNKRKQEVLLFSNLFWKWRYPFYDAVFAYHWFIYELQHQKGITPEKVKDQRQIWMDEMLKLPEVKDKETLLQAALLERSVAGLLLDSLLLDTKKSIAYYLNEATRAEVKRFIDQTK